MPDATKAELEAIFGPLPPVDEREAIRSRRVPTEKNLRALAELIRESITPRNEHAE